MTQTIKTTSATPTVNTAVKELRSRLTPLYGRGETEAVIRLIFQYLKGWSAVDLIINENRPLSDYIREKINEIENRLLRHEPIQYITGLAYFYGMDFHVRPGVLVPRPETEELIDMIVAQNKRSDLRVLDVGTGSGCIAVALARNLAFSKVTALDLSEQALDVARENADLLHASQNITFENADIFTWQPAEGAFDIIVSNPPYVDESEKKDMEPNVLDYEPAQALFVPDSDPLRYYRRIGEIGRDALVPGGRLYFEINPRHARAMESLMASLGYEDIVTKADIHCRSRFLTCTRPKE